MQAAVHIINRVPLRVLQNLSAYEVFFGRPPDLLHLKVVGCLCYIANLDHSDNFAHRAIKCVFLGYSMNQKGYRVLDLQTKRVVVSRDVKFFEQEFPFKTDNNSTSEMLEVSPPPPPAVSVEVSPPVELSPISPLVPSNSDAPATDAIQSPDPVLSNDSFPEQPLVHAPSPVEPRAKRVSKAPSWLQDYVTLGKDISPSSSVVHPLQNHLSYKAFTSNYISFLSATNDIIEPATKQAVKDPRWPEAMSADLEALINNHTWDLVTLPPGKNPVGCKWIYKIKLRPDGQIERFKSRLVAKGYTQQEGIDFTETFSPVAKAVTIRCVLTVAAQLHLPLFHLDVNNVFLNGDLFEEVYMTLPPGLLLSADSHGKVCRLQVSTPRASGRLPLCSGSPSACSPSLRVSSAPCRPAPQLVSRRRLPHQHPPHRGSPSLPAQ